MALQLPVVQTGLEASIQAAMKNAGKGAVINLGTSAKQISSLSQPLGRITGQADQFTKSMEAANARVFAFGASVGIINNVASAFKGVIKSTIEVESSLAKIYSVLDKAGSSSKDFENGLFQAAKNAGQSFQAAADAALELSRQGLNSQEVLKRLNDSLILTRLSGLDSAAAVEGLSAAFNSFAGTGITTTEILNKLVAVSQKYAVSEKDLIEGIKRAGSTAQQAGVSFDELAGLITAVQEKTARGGAVIGNSFKTIFARLQDKGTLEYLSNLGIGVTDLEGKVLPATAIMEGLASKFKDFSKIGQADIAEKLGGIYQLGNLLAALQDLSSEQSKYTGAVKVSLAAADQAYQKNAALNQTLESILNRVSVSAQQLGATLGELGVTDNLKSILDFFNKLLDGIQSILQEDSGIGKFFKGLVAGIGNLISGPGLALFGAIILKLSKDLAQFGFSSLKSFFGIGQAAREIQNVEKSVAQALSTNVSLQQRLLALEGDRAAQLRVISAEIISQEAMLRRIASTSAAIAPGLYGGGVRSTGQGLRIPKAADGYMPAVSQEASSINRGVGGAKASDKPVVIPNFNFGGGKRGTMVANSGEHIVPNFNGGNGSAIFNRDMVRKMGMPVGAQKINSAGGFIPNYADQKDQQYQEWLKQPGIESQYQKLRFLIQASESPVAKVKNPAQVKLREFNNYLLETTDETRGVTLEAKKKEANDKFKTSQVIPRFGMLYPSATDDGVHSRVAGDTGEAIKTIPIVTQPSDLLFTEVREGIIKAGVNYAKGLGFKPDIVQEDRFAKGIQENLNVGTIEAAFGTVFESVFHSAMGVKSANNQGLDLKDRPTLNTFVESMQRGGILANSVGNNINKQMVAADFKNNLSPDNLTSMVKKIKNWKTLNEPETSAKGFIPNFANTTVALGKDPEYARRQRERSAKAQKYRSASGTIGNLFKVLPEKFFADLVLGDAGHGLETEGIFKTIKDSAMYSASFAGPNAVKFVQGAESYGLKVSKSLQDKLTKLLVRATTKSGASGFLPNFADPIQAAIGREMSAGVPASQIYIDQNSSLKSAMNPNGLMVANRIDEPMGGIQGIARARKEGANPMTYGAANGFVPNYATSGSFQIPGNSTFNTQPSVNQSAAVSAAASAIAAAVTAAIKLPLPVPAKPNASIMQAPAPDPKASSEKMLGTIFAVQGALSVLQGVVGEVSGSLGQAIQGITSIASSATTAAFAVQGLSGMGGAIGSVSKALGPLAIGATIAYGIFKEGGKILDNYSGVASSAALSLEKVSKAAESAAVKLSDYGTATQEEIKKRASKLFEKVTTYTETTTNTSADMNKARAFLGQGTASAQAYNSVNATTSKASVQLEGWTDALKESITQQLTLATAAGIGAGKIEALFNGITVGNKITKEAAEKAALALADMVFSTKEYSSVLDKITPESPEAQKFLVSPSEFEAAKNISKPSQAGNIFLNPFQQFPGKGQFAQEMGLMPRIDSEAKKALLDKKRISLLAEDASKKAASDKFIQTVPVELYKKELESILEINEAKMESERISKDADTQALQRAEALGGLSEVALATLRNKIALDLEDRKMQGEYQSRLKKMTEGIGAFGSPNDRKLLKDKINEVSLKDKITLEDILDIYRKTLVTQGKYKEEIDGIVALDETTLKNRKELLFIGRQLTSEEQNRKLATLKTKEAIDEMVESASHMLNMRNFNIDLTATIRTNEIEKKIRELETKQPLNVVDSRAQESKIAGLRLSLAQTTAPLNAETDLNNAKTAIIDLAKTLGYSKDAFASLSNSINQSKNKEELKLNARIPLPISNTITKSYNQRVDAEYARLAQSEVDVAERVSAATDAFKKANLVPVVKKFSDYVIDLNDGIDAAIEQGKFEFLSATSGTGLLDLASKKKRDLEIKSAGTSSSGIAKAYANEASRADERRVALAGSASERVKLQYEVGINEAILAIKQENVDTLELTEEQEARILELEKKRLDINKSLGQRFKEAFATSEADQIDRLNTALVDGATKFRDTMIDGVIQAVESGKSLKEILVSAAMDFTREMTRAALRNVADSVIGGATSLFSAPGGQKMASGGSVSGGSGSKDDVPAMLMGGEYVINKKSVNKYGPAFLDAINSGTLNGYAKGGKVNDYFVPGSYKRKSLSGQKDWLGFATQAYTSGSKDKIRSGNGFQSIALEPESIRLTNFGRRRQTALSDYTKEVKSQAFGIMGQENTAARELKMKEEAEKKSMKKQIMNSILMLIGSAVVGFGASKLNSSVAAKKATSGSFGSNLLSGLSGIFTKKTTPETPTSMLNYRENRYEPSPDASLFPFGNIDALTKRATGGLISEKPGIDTIPTMLSGGEFVMNRAAAQNIGAGPLQAMNAGASSMITEEKSVELNDKLIKKLDELVGASSESKGNVSISINSTDGRTTSSSQTNDGSPDSRQKLAQNIKDVVLKVIQDEKRLGGQLRRGM
jgi:TP901 family phage tail tape measure protein